MSSNNNTPSDSGNPLRNDLEDLFSNVSASSASELQTPEFTPRPQINVNGAATPRPRLFTTGMFIDLLNF